ncbi:TonB-dependent receptor domain-containing protein [Brevundimonas naejangsanensis]|uniref:TonB-dependent receptor domain-containing protein n=1 Tax=Brevundimonas naejangsanensis TaxID=588932 RepID=UPI0032096A28
MQKPKVWLRGSLLACTALACPGWALAQDAGVTQVDEVVVVGSQIRGAKVTAALPVTRVDREEIDAVAAVSGDDLYRSIPQMGDVSFNSTNGATSSNFARGDVGSVNLRNLGVGNTLVLLNGRRMVAHPGSQADDQLVPVITYNTNAIPVSGLQRLEVLRDGAAAIYGADAVGGVVNNVLRRDLNGGSMDVQYGGAEGTGLREFEANLTFGRNIQDDRGNVSLFLNYTDRTELSSGDQYYTRSADKRPLFEGTRFEGAASLDRRNTLSAWADLQTPASFGYVTSNGVRLTNAAGVFHVRPETFGGCLAGMPGGVCLKSGARATGGADRELRYDSSTNPTSIMPELKRYNAFLTGRYALTDSVEAYGELGYYLAKTRSNQGPVFTIGSTKVAVPASNYWNPFGPVTFANGQLNPNRLPDLNVPVEGLPVTLTNYRFVDLGGTVVDVETSQMRALAGLKGQAFGFDWDTAFVYSEAKVTDEQDGISSTLLQQNLALSTPDAYNPFSGGDPVNPATGGDASPSSQAALDAIRVNSVRRGRTTLALWDFKVSRPDVFSLPAGDVGMAAGVEFRRETQLDDRDARVDGTIKYKDAVTGELQEADLFGVSPTPDTRGSRTVASAFVEFAAPLVSPEMGVPLMRSLEVQLAGRFEEYSDFGRVAKPKIAAAWDVVDGVRLRGSWSQGFRAPNLEQVNASLVTRGNTRTDWVLCEADLQAGRIKAFSGCSRSVVATAQRSGNPNLKPEESESWGAGLVLEPRFTPESWGDFTFTVDYWAVKQEGIVGLFGEGNALILDYVMRMQGSSNPNVIRAPLTAEDIAAVANTTLEPVGAVVYVKDQYVNLQPQDVRGLDLGMNWRKRTERFGSFDLALNAAHLIRFYRAPSPDITALMEARESGLINAGVGITGGGELSRRNGKPEWKWSAALTWRQGPITVGGFTSYVSDVDDTGLVDAEGQPWIVESQITANLYGQYEFQNGWASGTRMRVGVRNLTDEAPSLASNGNGYLGALYQPYSRYWYASVRKTF